VSESDDAVTATVAGQCIIVSLSRLLRSSPTPKCDDAVYNDVAAAGAGIGAELHVVRPALLVRRLAGKSAERQDPSALREARDGEWGNNLSVPEAFSETEAKTNRGIDRVAIEEAVRQAAIDL
jgi:hypothetical protein